jgi:hypothetical protein
MGGLKELATLLKGCCCSHLVGLKIQEEVISFGFGRSCMQQLGYLHDGVWVLNYQALNHARLHKTFAYQISPFSAFV